MNLFTAFQLVIASEIDLPELFPIQTDIHATPDIKVTLGRVPPNLRCPLLSTPWYEMNRWEFLLKVEGVSKYYAAHGDRIIIEPEESATEKDIRVFLLKTVLLHLLYQRGLVVLSASSVKIGSTGVVFAGHSGGGKTSVALELALAGMGVLSDDRCVIEIVDGKSWIVPGVPQLNVWHDSLMRVGKNPLHYQATRNGINKFCYDVKHSFCLENTELSSMIFLMGNNRDNIELRRSNGVQKLQYLMRYLVHADIYERDGRLQKTLSNSMTIARESRLYSMEFNPELHSPDMLVDLILKEVGRHE